MVFDGSQALAVSVETHSNLLIQPVCSKIIEEQNWSSPRNWYYEGQRQLFQTGAATAEPYWQRQCMEVRTTDPIHVKCGKIFRLHIFSYVDQFL